MAKNQSRAVFETPCAKIISSAHQNGRVVEWKGNIEGNMKKVITFGTFDVFHVGHINILERAAEMGNYLVVGVSSDQLNFSKKNRYPVYSEADRCRIIASLKFVDEVFLEESLELKKKYIEQHNADLLVMGDDWAGRFDWVKDVCEVLYLPRTPSISTTEIIEVVKNLK